MTHGRPKGSIALPRSRKDEPPVRIFQSERLERLTLISVRVFLSTWIPIIILQFGVALWIGAASTPSVLAASVGFCAWFMFEYVMHRFLFHLKSKNKHIAALVWVMHTNHHVQPSHRLRTLMPLSVSLPLALIFELLSIGLLGSSLGTAAMSGFLLGYVVYDITHYACHNFPMKGRHSSVVKRHHMRHHFMDEESNYSITLPIIDRLFWTRR